MGEIAGLDDHALVPTRTELELDPAVEDVEVSLGLAVVMPAAPDPGFGAHVADPPPFSGVRLLADHAWRGGTGRLDAVGGMDDVRSRCAHCHHLDWSLSQRLYRAGSAPTSRTISSNWRPSRSARKSGASDTTATRPEAFSTRALKVTSR